MRETPSFHWTARARASDGPSVTCQTTMSELRSLARHGAQRVPLWCLREFVRLCVVLGKGHLLARLAATPHTVQVRTVHQHVVRREAPAPVPEVRTGGLYRGAPCTVGTKDRLHRSLCAPSVFSKSRTLLANMTKMSEAYPQTLKNSCYNNVCAWHLRPKGHLTYQRSHFDYILTVLRPFS